MKNKLFDLLRKNLLYLFSLFLSLSLWFYVLSTEELEINKKVQIDYILPKGKGISSKVVETAQVKLIGPRAFVRGLEQKDISFTVNLAKTKRGLKGIYKIETKKADLPLPFGVSIKEASPSSIEVKLDRLISREIPLEVNLVGETLENHRLISAKTSPKKIKVMGVKKILDGHKKLETIPVELKDLSGKGEREISLKQVDSRLVIPEINDLKLLYDIRPTKANLQISGIKVRFLSSRPVRKASSRKVSLLVLSDKGEDIKINKSQVRVIADVPEDKKGKVRVKLRAELPEGVHLLKIQPETIFVYIR